MACKRRRNIVQKCTELAAISGLKISVIFYDEERSILQEFFSDANFTINQFIKIKLQKAMRILDPIEWKKIERKNYPHANYVEQTLMSDYVNSLKSLRKRIHSFE